MAGGGGGGSADRGRTAALAAAAAAAAAASVAAAAALALARRWRAAAEEATVELLEGETSPVMLGMAPAISTVTFYEGPHADAAAYLRRRVVEVLRLNPWLGGRLARRRGRVVLVYSADAGDGEGDGEGEGEGEGEGDGEGTDGVAPVAAGAAAVFRHCAPGEVPLSRATPYGAMARAAASALVGKGSESLGSGAPVLRVSVVPDAAAPEARWALVASLSHVVADGHTFYRVLGMLSETERAAALSPRRLPGVAAAGDRAMRGDGGFLQRPAPGLLISLVASMAAGKVVGPSCEVGVWHVDEAFVARKKAAAAAARGEEEGGVEWVSTNDVITSTLLAASGADVGTMDVNFRGRVAGASEDLAGNYEDKITYRPRDFATPALIRRSIADAGALGRRAEPRTELPRTVGEFWRCRMISAVSNWSSFHRDVSLMKSCGSRADLHLPLFRKEDVPARAFTGAFVFRAKAGAPLAVALAAKPAVLDAVSRCGILGRRVDLA